MVFYTMSMVMKYKVLTDNEADDEVREYIEQSVWAFNPSFLSAHAKDEIDEDVFKVLSEKCEGSNEAVKSLIKDFDHFVDDAVLSDGRGHFLSSYDGCEHEVNIKNNYYYIYRTNNLLTRFNYNYKLSTANKER
jgi:hypothetical protein